MRKNLEIKCKICGLDTKTNGIAFHLKSKHNISTEEYIKKFGEYRPKYIDYLTRSSEKWKCEICQTECASQRHFSFHIRIVHNLRKIDYIKKYIYKDTPQFCKCGCGIELPIKTHYPYTNQYITGHNSFMHIGMKRDNESRMKMRLSAIKRIKDKKGVFFYNGISKEELELRKFITDNYNGKIYSNDKIVLSGLELDIYLPELSLAIELNGDRFHSDLYKPKKYHLKKTEECNNLGIHLVHIWLTDWCKKKDIIKSILLNKLKITPNKIGARNTDIKYISNDEYQNFLKENHLQGPAISKVRLGLFNDNKLVQILGLSANRNILNNSNIKNEWELIRMCSLKNTSIIGGANKLLKKFILDYHPSKITSYADRDWSDGKVYEKLGFLFKKFTPIGYFYVKSKIKYNRIQFQKHKLIKEGADPTKTEYEIMTENGYYRIWNTGNFIYEMELN